MGKSDETEPNRACSDCLSESTYLSKTENGTSYYYWYKHPYYPRRGSPKEVATARVVKVHNPIPEEEEI